MNILEQIIGHKRQEVAENKVLFPASLLEKSPWFDLPVMSLKKTLLNSQQSGIIAEIKRKSPSKGIINPDISIEQISTGYVKAGASALSVLTDTHFFGGSNTDFVAARKFNKCPMLRKDFIIDEYQVVEAKSIGADVILLIAAVLSPEEVKRLIVFAHSFGLEVLLEVHNREELQLNLNSRVDLIGVNNRDLKSFQINVDASRQLAKEIPASLPMISESGIDNPATILELRTLGYQGFLMGQHFMEQPHPEEACSKFIAELNRLKGQLQ